MAIKIRRGLEADRTSVIFEEGEVLYTTDTKSFFIGDGVTAGGNQIGGTTAAELLKTEVHNATGATLTAGQVVYLSGNTGNKPNAVLAKADAEATSSKTIGLIILDIANNANGFIATDGLLGDLNTSMFAPGDMLWLSDSISGGVTTIVPDTPNHAVFIGYVVSAHPTQGKILIHIQNGYELNELHDVKITSPVAGDVLGYDSTLGYWKNKTIAAVLGYTPVSESGSYSNPSWITSLAWGKISGTPTTLGGYGITDAVPSSRTLTINGTTYDLSANRSWTIASFIPPDGLLKTGAAISTTFQAITDYLGNASVLFLNSRRVGIGKDTSVTTQSVAVVEVQDANTSIVLKPNGTGAIIASVPDGTATGGNARGTGAVDLQLGTRDNSNQVASGLQSTIINGTRNRSSNTQASVINGDLNLASGSQSFIGNGSGNTASGQRSFIGNGFLNNATSDYSTISGGQSNTASTNTHATVVGGQGNTASGQYSVVGGNNNTSSGISTITFGNNNNNINGYCVQIGQSNTNTGSFGFAIGNGNTTDQYGFAFGVSNRASGGFYTTAIGYLSNAYLRGQNSLASGYFSAQGDAQQSLLTARNSAALTTGATLVLSLDGTGTTNLIIPNGTNRAWNVQIDTIAVVTAITGTATGVSVGDCYRETKQLSFKRIGGTSSIVGTVDTTSIKSDTSMSTAALTVTAGASQQMALTFTAPTFAGAGSVTCRVVSKVSLVEVAY